MATSQPLEFPPLDRDTQTDVCIVGAGIAGLSTAYFLVRSGRRVIVLDHGPVGYGETARTTAHLSNALDDRYYELERYFGANGARAAAHSHSVAIDHIETITSRESIDCGFTRLDGYLFLPPGESISELERELDSAHRAGLGEVALVPSAPVSSFNTGPCLRFPRQGQFHPLKYLAGLARAVVKAGGRICTGTHVDSIDGGRSASIHTAAGLTVAAGAVVVATNSPIHDNLQIHFKQSPYRTYVIAAPVPPGSVPQILLWDTPDPYHYVRLDSSSGQDMLIFGGEDHRTGEEDDGEERFSKLEEWARARFPISEVKYQWSGQVMEPSDGMALIGRDRLGPENLFFATGDSGQGMTHGTIAGMLLTDLILGRQNPWSCIYDPSRFPVQSTEFYQENADVLWHYFEWLTSGDVGDNTAIEPGEGAIIRRGLSKIAGYRDDNGQLHEFSAICPHLGCVVAWNSTEHIWDCPCHGSHFDRYGHVLNGPARSDLSRI